MTEKISKDDLYRQYYGKVFGYIYTRINNRQDAEDLTSDVFVKIFEKLDSYDENKASLSTWIYTVSRNTLTDYYRTRKVSDELAETVDDGDSPDDEVCKKEMLEALAKGLSALDTRERDIIILRFYSGKTLKEIAEQMGISYAYVKILQNKALDRLRDYLV